MLSFLLALLSAGVVRAEHPRGAHLNRERLRVVRRYVGLCDQYRVKPHPDIMCALRWQSATLAPGRVFPGGRRFCDHDVLPLVELLQSCGGAARCVTGLSFAEGCKLHSSSATAIAELLRNENNELRLTSLDLSFNSIGAAGGRALASALKRSPSLKIVRLKGCALKRGGVEAIAEVLRDPSYDGPAQLDLRSNGAGFNALRAMERVAASRSELSLDLDGNLVLSEVLNMLTHGTGLLLAIAASFSLLKHISELTSLAPQVRIGVAAFSVALLSCYASSTAYHATFALGPTRHVFHICDQCAIYVLIAGTYAPIMAAVGTRASLGALAAVASLGALGVGVEAYCHNSRRKKQKWIKVGSVVLYILMGWTTIIPPVWRDVSQFLPAKAVKLLIAGGVAYTLGVPLFARNHHLDHAIWHLFVLAGSIMHYGVVRVILNAPQYTMAPELQI